MIKLFRLLSKVPGTVYFFDRYNSEIIPAHIANHPAAHFKRLPGEKIWVGDLNSKAAAFGAFSPFNNHRHGVGGKAENNIIYSLYL